MIRLSLLTLFITVLCLYAWRDWYKAVCGLIVLMAVIEHPDMPKTIMGVQGLNPWNIAFLFVCMAWLASKRREGLVWDMPRKINVLLLLYLAVILIGFYRMLGDDTGRNEWAAFFNEETRSTLSITSEYLVNALKWVIPGLLLFHGCTSKSRLMWAVSSMMLVYILLSIQIIRWMPVSALVDGDALSHYGLKLGKEIGYHRVNLSMMLSGAFWAIICVMVLYKPLQKRLLGLSTILVFMGQALTGGRMGYVTWAAVGAVISMIRWRRYLVIAPVLIFLLLIILPATMDRFTQGFDEEKVDTNPKVEAQYDNSVVGMQLYTITSGRSFAWPFVIEQIEKAPFVGYGREAMIRLGVSSFLLQQYGENFPHPHNAYLMWLIDNGWIGLIPVALFYLLVLKYSLSLLRDKRDPVFVAVGGMAFALTSALLIASFGSQSFYPREGAVGMWCAMGLMFRIYIERAKLISGQITESKLLDFRPEAEASVNGRVVQRKG